MAFETLTPLISYPADGVTTTFAIPDKFYDASDVKVFYIDADGIETQLDTGAEYSVLITATDPTPPSRKSGNVVIVTPPLTGGFVVVFIWPGSDQDQPFEGQPVTPRQNERVHDRHSMRDAALRELLFRGFRAPLNAAPALRFIEVGAAGRVPVYAPDGSGSLVEGPTIGEVALVSGIVDEIVLVASIAPQVVSVAGNSENINLVAGGIGSVVTVGANIGSVVTVASNIAAVTNASDNMAAIIAAPGAASAAASSASAAAGSVSAAAVSAGAAAGSASAAAGSAAAAAASAASIVLPGAPVALNYLRRNAANTAYEVRTPAQVISDISALRYDAAAGLTLAQKKQARDNIETGERIQGFSAVPSAAFADITGIPAGVKRIIFKMLDLSTNGTSPYILQLGAGALSTSGYRGSGNTQTGSNLLAATTGIPLTSATNVAANSVTGFFVLERFAEAGVKAGVWMGSGTVHNSGGGSFDARGNIDLGFSAVLDQIRLTTVNGTDLFDNGFYCVAWEF